MTSSEQAPTAADWYRSPRMLVAAVCIVIMCWIVGNPRSAGPDEPSHMVASAALVRGERDGAPSPTNERVRIFEIPGMVGEPDPVCWAFQPDTPVGCAPTSGIVDVTLPRSSSSYEYAPWAYILPGLASYLPTPSAYAYIARMANAAIPALLFTWSCLVLLRRRRLLATSVLAGATPIVWFTFGTVNPSAVAIAGGLALWAGLLAGPARQARMLSVAGWAAVLLARRDGPLWATAIVLVSCALLDLRPREVWRQLGRWPQVVVGACALLAFFPSLERGDLGFDLALAAAPIGLIVADLLIGSRARLTTSAARRSFSIMVTIGVAVAATIMVLLRPGGVRATTLRLIISNTGEHLRQLVGVLGWLDAPVPTSAVLLYWAAIGGLTAVALIEFRRAAIVFGSALAAAIALAWLLELGQGADNGRYWQGRYTMPFAIGFPLILAWRPRAGALADRLNTPLAISGWVVANLGFVAAQRRWGVGVNGTWDILDWNSWGSPVSPVTLVTVHLIATSALFLCVVDPERRSMASVADPVTHTKQ